MHPALSVRNPQHYGDPGPAHHRSPRKGGGGRGGQRGALRSALETPAGPTRGSAGGAGADPGPRWGGGGASWGAAPPPTAPAGALPSQGTPSALTARGQAPLCGSHRTGQPKFGLWPHERESPGAGRPAGPAGRPASRPLPCRGPRPPTPGPGGAQGGPPPHKAGRPRRDAHLAAAAVCARARRRRRGGATRGGAGPLRAHKGSPWRRPPRPPIGRERGRGLRFKPWAGPGARVPARPRWPLGPAP